MSAPNSIRPLKIPERAMQNILTQHNVGPQFLNLLLSFATGSHETEAGPGSMTVKNSPDGSYGMSSNCSIAQNINTISRSAVSFELCGRSSRSLVKFMGHSTDGSLPSTHSRKSGEHMDILASKAQFSNPETPRAVRSKLGSQTRADG